MNLKFMLGDFYENFVDYHRRTHIVWGSAKPVRETDDEVLSRLGWKMPSLADYLYGSNSSFVIYDEFHDVSKPSTVCGDPMDAFALSIFTPTTRKSMNEKTDEQLLADAKRKIGEDYAEFVVGSGSYEALAAARKAYDTLKLEIAARKKAAEAEAARIAALPKLLDRDEAAKMESLYTFESAWGPKVLCSKADIVRGTVDLANARAKAYYKSRYNEAVKGLRMTEAARAALEAIFA